MARGDLGDFFVAFFEVVEKLASESGCPWDREQTVFTLTDSFREECDELIDAVSSGSSKAVVEELGDVLYLVCLSAAAADRRGSFNMRQVLREIRRKAVSRHPQQFGGSAAKSESEKRLAADGSASVEFLSRKQKEQPRFCWSRTSLSRPEMPA